MQNSLNFNMVLEKSVAELQFSSLNADGLVCQSNGHCLCGSKGIIKIAPLNSIPFHTMLFVPCNISGLVQLYSFPKMSITVDAPQSSGLTSAVMNMSSQN